jgi:hypothetical protein
VQLHGGVNKVVSGTPVVWDSSLRNVDVGVKVMIATTSQALRAHTRMERQMSKENKRAGKSN